MAEISRDTSFTDNGVGYVCKQIYRYVDVAAYFRAFVILGDARGSVDASVAAERSDPWILPALSTARVLVQEVTALG